MSLLINNIHEKFSRCLSNGNARVSRNQEKVHYQLRHRGRALDLKVKDFIGHV